MSNKQIFMLSIGAVSLAIGLLFLRQNNAEKTAGVEGGEQRSEATTVDHYYDFQDGMQYGYTLAVSDADRTAGKASSQVTMFLYAGQRGGKHQLHVKQASLLTAIECSVPCDVAKVLAVMDVPGVPSPAVAVNRMRLAPNSVAYLALSDAANGKLRQYGLGDDNASYSVWLDEEKGILKERRKATQ